MIVTNSSFRGSVFLKRQRSICQKQVYCRFVIFSAACLGLSKFVRSKRLQNSSSLSTSIAAVFIYIYIYIKITHNNEIFVGQACFS